MQVNCCNPAVKQIDKELLLIKEQRSGVLRWNLFLVKTAERTTKNLEYHLHIKLLDKAAARFERIDSNFESSSVV